MIVSYRLGTGKQSQGHCKSSMCSYLLSFLSSPQEGFLILKYNLSSANIYLVFQAKLETEECVLRKGMQNIK